MVSISIFCFFQPSDLPPYRVKDVAFMKVSHALGNIIIIKDNVGAHDLNVVNVTALLDDTAWLTSNHVDGYTRMLTAAFEAVGEKRNFKILDHSFFKFLIPPGLRPSSPN